MLEKPRRENHALIWMAMTRAKCECGKMFEVPRDECAGKAPGAVRDRLIDEHAEHIKK